jgi:pimeloyl-ACP methyl ester carboxylesterase
LPEEPKIKSWSTKINYDIPDRAPRKTQTKSRFPFRPHGHRTNFNRFHDELERRVGKHGNAQGKKSSTTHNSITQSLDHFDPSVTDTWTQYFYANNASYSDGGPNFLMLGGEGPISYWDVSTDLAMGQWGQEYNAMLYSVEHRFYGQSQPFDDLSTDHLKYLTSQQALADAAVFINQINTDRNLTNPVWVVFGGSYPGNLAAWFRLKYPQLMIGSIASSAPVQAKTDYYEYLLVVENSTRAFGPDGCADNVQAFSTWLQNQTTTVAGRTAVASSFNLCGDWSADWVTEKDLEMVLSVTIDSMAGYVQYDDDAHQRLAQACGQFSSSSGSSSDSSSAGSAYYDAAEEGSPGHATISKIMQHYKEMTPEAPSKRCNDYSYADYVTYFQNIGPDDGDDAAMRGWVWQTCNEFGFFQSTDRGYNIFESAQPVNFYVDFCADVYGPQFTRDTIDANVRATNAYYGGAYAYNGTNVVFPNGSEDPWHALSVYNPINVNVTSVLIDGTSHCYDMYADDDSDTDALTAGRAQIKAILDSWLGN